MMHITVPYDIEYAGKEFEIALSAGNSPEVNVTLLTSTEYREIMFEDSVFVEFVDGVNLWSVNLKNGGTVEETVVLECTAPAGWDVSLSSPIIHIAEGNTKSVNVSIRRNDDNPANDDIIITANGLESAAQLLIPVPPVAKIDVPTGVLWANQDIEFSANCTGCVGYSWELDGEDKSGETVYHTFSLAGEYEISLTVEAENGMMDRITEIISIENTNPIAYVTVTPGEGRMIFDAENSSDTDGSIVEYLWEINGQESSGPVVIYSFEDAGIYSVKLTVTDNLGGTNATISSVTVEKENSLKVFESRSGEGNPDIITGWTILFILLLVGISFLYWNGQKRVHALLLRMGEMEKNLSFSPAKQRKASEHSEEKEIVDLTMNEQEVKNEDGEALKNMWGRPGKTKLPRTR